MSGQLVQMLYSGLVLGAVYSIMAMGLALIWSGVRLLNLAHGALFTVGGYAAYSMFQGPGLPAVLGPVVGFVAAGFVGAIVYLVVYRPLMRRSDWENATLAGGLGAAVLIEAAIVLIYGAREDTLPAILSGEVQLPAGVVATGEGIAMMIVGVGVFAVMAVTLARTRYGVSVRALASNSDGAKLVGVNTTLVLLSVVVIGSALAGMAGVLYSSFYFLSPVGGFTALLKALIVTIVGGLGNIRGTVVAAYLVGLIEAGVAVYLGSRWSLPLLFTAIAVLLVFRPSGLAPRRTLAEASR
jgi:branched-chain amino acid transport system permease protein